MFKGKFTAVDPFVSKRYTVMLNFSESVLMKKQTHLHLPVSEYIFGNYSFKKVVLNGMKVSKWWTIPLSRKYRMQNRDR